MFFSGQEASTSVIGTALFQELPSYKVTVQKHDADDEFGDDFGFSETIKEKTAKQFIAFSDSRQAAAFYASYVIETNVLQRSFSEMLPSEKAAVLALRYSKMICQGRRNDIIEELKKLENPDEIRENKTCGIDCHKSKSRDVVGAEYNLKGRAVANYLRINELSVALKIRIDDGEFTIAAAVQLSYLAQEEQQMVEAVLSESEYKVNEGKAVLLREYTGKLTPERAEQILSGEFSRKPKKSTAAAFKVKPAIYKKYFTASITQKEFDSIVDEALALYFAQKEAAAV